MYREEDIKTRKHMPEVSSVLEFHRGPVDWVGMEKMQMSIKIGSFVTPALIDSFIDLKDSLTRGVHMSRIYETTFAFSQDEITPASIKHTLEEFIQKHKGISSCAKIRIQFNFSKIVNSLLSGQRGWRTYPVKIYAQLKNGVFSLQLGCQLLYSSTCPCSAVLSRQLIQEKASDFLGDQSLIPKKSFLDWIKNGEFATPHSQRSVADIFVLLKNESMNLSYEDLIEKVQLLIPTEVQAAVKREDEQDFARINGQNLMFCEDACRKIASALQKDPLYFGYYVKVLHQESLHPHEAVSVLSKNFETL